MKKRLLALIAICAIALAGCGSSEGSFEGVEVDGKIMEEAGKLGFRFGTVVNPENLSNKSYSSMVTSHFNTITAENEMKAYSLLDQPACMSHPNDLPVMNYTRGDTVAAFAQANGLKVRGHVLVWDAYMCDWFFREGYENKGSYVDSDVMRERLRYYINDVVTHFETKYPGVVSCWDVVNESVGEAMEEYDPSDPRQVRMIRDGAPSPFYEYIGEDYVEFAFLCARDTIDRLKAENEEVSIELFYNDYNAFYPEKCDAICELVTSVNSYAESEDGGYRRLCDGIGMQGYIGGYGMQQGCMNENDITLITDAVKRYHDLGYDVHITEMAIRNYDYSAGAEHAKFYGELFAALAKLNEKEPYVTNVSIWGVCDMPYSGPGDYSYKQNSPYCGLFNENCEPKQEYIEVLNALRN